MASNTAKLPPPPSSNHVLTAPKGVPGGNRKKAKRRAKALGKSTQNSHLPPTPGAMPADLDYDEDPLGYGDEDEFDYSDEAYNDSYGSPHGGANGYNMPPPQPGKKKAKKKKTSSLHQHSPYNPELLGNDLPPMPNPPPPPAGAGAMPRAHRPGRKETIWNTSSAEERQNIKDFWLNLTEDERKSLLKIEKDTVLRKMKQQQKTSCPCTVCGRKRTAIEEELEVLYEGYYEELEQYAHHDHPPFQSADGMVPDPLQHRAPHPLSVPPPQPPPHHHHHHHPHRTSHVQEHFDEDEFSEDEEEEEEYSDEEYSDDDDDDDAEDIPRSNVSHDFLNFGQNLTVKGILTPWLERLQHELKGNADNILTVADDLLKNDGRKFIEMMEQLAERRMQRENEAEYAAANPSHPGAYPPGDHYNHEDPLAAGDEFDDDEASYDSQDDFDEDYDEMEDPAMDEEERVREGRRMFQIFAARMFEQRVLTAYREKVAQERQRKLLEELEDETKKEAQREEKKQRDAQKKKDKKKQQQQAKAEEKAKKEAEKAAEEARIKEAEEKKQEEQRRKKDEQRRKKDEEKKKQDEERARKDAEKARRQQEEQQRREEAERKAREQKAAEKAKKDEAKKREREEREAREKEARERKALEETQKKEREAKAKAEKEAKEREKAAQQAAHPPTQPQQIQKRPSQPGMVAVPGVYPKQTGSGISSPHPSIATPAIPKAPTPAKQRQASQQGSLASSPKQSASQVSSVPSKSSSPNSAGANQAQQPQTMQPKAIMQKAGNQQPNTQPPHPMQSTSPNLQQQIQPPPGMPHPQQHPGGFGGMQPMGYPGFQGPQGPMMHVGQRGPMPMYPPQHGGPPMGMQSRFGHPPMNGMTGPPPGMMPPQGRGMGYPFDMAGAGQPPPGFGPPQPPQQPNVTPPIGPQAASAAPGGEVSRPMASHSRQPSASEKERFESAANQPIARPAPIQRPSSVKPHSQERRGSNTDLDDLSKHLGSSALLDDSDEPIPGNLVENRRQSNLQPGNRTNQPGGGMPPIGGFGPPGSGFGAPFGPFGQAPGLGQQQWGPPGMNMNMNMPLNSWNTNNVAFAANSGFGAMGPGGQMHRPAGSSLNRPLTIRLAVCQACKQLTQANRGEGDGYHAVEILLRQIEANRPALDSPPTLNEIEEICETEGDSQNGGGELHVRKDGGGDTFAVKWAPDATTPDQGRGMAGLGEIGSPMPNKSSPSAAASFGAAPGSRVGGFPNLGAVGSAGNF